MRRFLGFSVLLLLVSPALAAPNEIELVPLQQSPLPALAKDLADCSANSGTTLVKRELKVGTVVFQSRHGCGWDAQATLAISNGNTTYTTGGTTISYRAGNMTEAPLHIRHVETRLTSGTLADGSALIVQQVDVQHEHICAHPPCAKGQESSKRIQELTFCTVPKGTAPPTCSSTRFDCPTSGCPLAAVTRGALALQTAKGTLKLTVRGDG
jgi:hypothetical protein